MSAGLASLARGHDLIVGAVVDPLEMRVPPVGRIRLQDPERPGHTTVLATGRARVRAAYEAAARSRRENVTRRVRGLGADCVWLRSDRDPLSALIALVRERSARRGAIT